MVGEASGVDEMLQSRRSSRVREFHKDDFESKDEEINELEFESNEECALEDY